MARHYLIVDDSPVIRQTLSKMLERLAPEPPKLSTAEDSESGLKTFREASPDVVFLDVRLPDVDGEQTLRVMFEENPETRVVVITGLMEDDEQVREMLSMGAFALLQKPIHTEDVEELLRLLDQEESGAGRIR